MMGIITEIPFPTYPDGFPARVVEPFERAIGRGVLANCAASGTEIIARFGEEHLRTGKPILYTSADSVFQVAAHEEVIPLEELYDICETARRLLVAPDNVQRVIARPFLGENAPTFRRTENRRDFPLAPPQPNILTALRDAGKRIHAVGVVAELFPRAVFTSAERTQSNPAHLAAIKRALASDDFDFLFANCEDFDMLFGHRNDPHGFAAALEAFDRSLAEIVNSLLPDDTLILTADHGNDPTTASTDHSREYVPLLAVGRGVGQDEDLGTRESFVDIGATIAAALGVAWNGLGESFLSVEK
jgi:phosphopentomutase